MKYLKWLAAACISAGILIWPEPAVNAGREAMHTWYSSVAPALFPFMVLLPILTGREVTGFYERIFRRLLPAALKLPGSAAPAMAIAMTAGSPAGAMAIMRSAAAGGWNRSAADRLTACLCGVSPAFLVGSVGVGMLNDPKAGILLLRTHLLSQGIMLLFTRAWKNDAGEVSIIVEEQDEKPLRCAIESILAVCGYMMMFQIAAALLKEVTGNQTAATAALCVLDLPSGAKSVAELALNSHDKYTILAAMSGIGGMCIAAQNISAGVDWKIYLPARLVNGALNALLMRIQLAAEAPVRSFSADPMLISTMIACFFLIPAWISFGNTSFLNKRKFAAK